MALPATPTEDSWPDEILAVARDLMNVVIDVVTTGTSTYDADADSLVEVTPDIVVLAARSARAQQLGNPIEATAAGEWAGKRRYRFQIEILDGDPLIKKGMVVRVKSGGRDPSLLSFRFPVITATNSSHAALRTIETYTEYAAVPDA